LPLRLIPPGAVVPVLSGPNRGYRWIVGSGVHGYWIGRYERLHQQLLAKVVSPRSVFFDIGAHVGFYSLLASRRVGMDGRVVAFEPNPRNVRFLKRHVAKNGVENVEIVQAAVSSTNGWVRFDDSGNSSMGHVRDDAGMRVPSVALDAWAAEHDLWPTVIKIDVEGHELPVLDGATKILSETHPIIALSVGPDSVASCRALLETHGYLMEPIVPSESPTEFACFPLPHHRSSD
jgi:FkbM family methyltransferase